MTHVVENNLWRVAGSCTAQRYRPTTLGQHRPNMYLKPVPLGLGGPVIAHGGWEEMKLNIRLCLTRVAANETADFKVIRGAQALVRGQPLHANLRSSEEAKMFIQRHRFGAGLLYIDLKMIHQVLTDLRAIN